MATAVAPQSFARFPDLPKELRDTIWRLCLPHRVVEVDFPDPEWYCEIKYQYGVDRDADMLRPDGTGYRCQMRHTTSINTQPPIISRVCHEARAVALETASFHFFPNQLSKQLVPAAWVDRARDSLCLHYFPHAWDMELKWDAILNYFLSLKNRTRVDTASISNDLIEAHDSPWMRDCDDIPQVLGNACPSYLVCTNVIVIHADELDAIHAGIFGLLGEERVVLVDAFDTKRLKHYGNFVLAHAAKQDPAVEVFFKVPSCTRLSGWPMIHYAETPQEYLQDLEIRWLLYSENRHSCSENGDGNLLRGNWLTTPKSFDDSDNDPRYEEYGDLPGRPFARQMWKPNRDHPWVQDALSRMLNFHPVVMFRLCTKDCWSNRHRLGLDAYLGPLSTSNGQSSP